MDHFSNDFPWRVEITEVFAREIGVPVTAMAMQIAETLVMDLPDEEW